MFIKNSWYVVAWNYELPPGGPPLARMVIEEPIVLFRTQDDALTRCTTAARIALRHYLQDRSMAIAFAACITAWNLAAMDNACVCPGLTRCLPGLACEAFRSMFRMTGSGSGPATPH